jgi:hypothetical protein
LRFTPRDFSATRGATAGGAAGDAMSVGDKGRSLDEAQLAKVRAAFDPAFYVATYPDVGEAGVDPFEHFMAHGWKEARDPRPDFSAAYYLEANRDVRESGINPFVHWVLYGRSEGRRATKPPAETAYGLDQREADMVRAAFDARFYVATYPDVSEARVDPFEHYMTHGWSEARDPRPDFSAAYYLEANRDVRETGINPFVHWVLYGRQEGRRTTTPPAPLKPSPAAKLRPPGAEGQGGAPDLDALPPRRRLRLAGEARRVALAGSAPGVLRDIMSFELAAAEKKIARLRLEVVDLEEEKALMQRQLGALAEVLASIDVDG